MPSVLSRAAPLVADGRVWRLQVDTYEREIERYGGPHGILVAEKIFWTDAEAVLKLLQVLSENEMADIGWRVALSGVDALLEILGLTVKQRLRIVTTAQTAFDRSFKRDRQWRIQLGSRFRQVRKDLNLLLAGEGLKPEVQSILRARSDRAQPFCAELHALVDDGKLSCDIESFAGSCTHMFVNRLLASAAPTQEIVIYDYLSRLYDGQLTREKRRREGGERPR
jgi:thiopeptide-type bacteriocin biosynthesis protein